MVGQPNTSISMIGIPLFKVNHMVVWTRFVINYYYYYYYYFLKAMVIMVI